VQDILNLSPSTSKPLDRMIIAAQVDRWLMDQLTTNVALVTQPESTKSFVKLADGSFNPPLGSADVLTSSSGAYTLTLKDTTALTFNHANSAPEGSIATWHSPAGPSVSFIYTSGNLSSVTTGTGSTGTSRTLTLNYTGSHLTSVSDGTGRSASYGYDSSGNLTSYTDAASKVTTFSYDSSNPGRLTQFFYPSFPTTAVVTNSYDTLGRVNQQQDALSHTTTYYLAGSRTEVDDPASTPHVTYFSQRGKLLIDIDGLGHQIVNAYDGLDRLTQMTLPEGNSTCECEPCSAYDERKEKRLSRLQDAEDDAADVHQGCRRGKA